MPDMQQLADSMLAAAATVLGRLVEQPAVATGASRSDHAGSVKTDADELVTLATIPSLHAQVVVRFEKRDVRALVGAMLGETQASSETGPMQLSIASETVSQIAVAMVEQLSKDIGTSSDGVHAVLCTDATLLPPPPFESYEGMVQVGADLTPNVAIDFAAITLSKLGVTAAQRVTFAPMQPTPVRNGAHANLDFVHDVPLQISAVLGKSAMPLRDVVAMQSGSIFELDKLSSEPIDLYVNNILIARGEVVVVDDKYAVKISELNPQAG